MDRLTDLTPESFAHWLVEVGNRRAWVATVPGRGPVASSGDVEPIAQFFANDPRDFRRHRAVFLEVGRETEALFGVFIHDTRRGQAQGGVRHLPYSSVEGFLRDGLRLSLGMGRKCALAGLWWGGGKAVIARRRDSSWADAGYRRALYAEFGRFVTSLRGCYVTAEDAGTTPLDMAEIYRHTRFVTCAPPEVGGSGNPASMTARGVVHAMEAALEFRGTPGLAGRRVAMQGGGNVASFMIEELVRRGVAGVVVSEISPALVDARRDHFAGAPVEIRLVDAGDSSILAEPCDVLAPNALGGVLGEKTIPDIRAGVVCGAANNQLVDELRDAAALEARGITLVPDYVANRLGIVACCNEHAGSIPDDPEVERHLAMDDKGSIYRTTLAVLEHARRHNLTPIAAANTLADRRTHELHPLWPHRAERIITSLTS